MAFNDLDAFQQKLIISLVELMATGIYQPEMLLRHVPPIDNPPFGFTSERWELEVNRKDGTRSHRYDLYQAENLSALTSSHYVEMGTHKDRTTVFLSAKAFQQYKFFTALPDEDTPKTELIRFWITRLEPIETELQKGQLEKAEQSFARWRERASDSISKFLNLKEGGTLAQFDVSQAATGIATSIKRARAFLEALLEDLAKYGMKDRISYERENAPDLKTSAAPSIHSASTLTLPRANHQSLRGILLDNRYEIKGGLGSGGMSTVYMAFDTRLCCTVAIKEKREATPGNSEAFQEAFEQEAKLLANLRHECLPKVTDNFSEGSRQFIVMEFIDGDDLERETAQRRSAFTESEVVRWANDLLEVLVYLHTQNPAIIHHDVKPANIKIRNGKPVLLDFGLSRGVAGQMSTLIHGEEPKYVHGYTPNYASPEQVQGFATDGRSDLFSLGATLYHLLVGHPPMPARDRLQAYYQQSTRSFEFRTRRQSGR